MNGKDLLEKLPRLNEINSSRDIPQLSAAIFPGNHCPMMGAIKALEGFKDALLVLVGSDECAYYAKRMTLNKHFGGIGGRCVSVVLNKSDVTFGGRNTFMKSFKEIYAAYKPKCVFLMTTCVVEVIGDDYDEIAEEISCDYGLPVAVVHTEHFKQATHLDGIKETITACAGWLQKNPCNGSVNILGQWAATKAENELLELLEESGVEIGLRLPLELNLDKLQKATSARLNIVVNSVALPLAEQMKQKYGIEYVLFNQLVCPDTIMKAYEAIFEVLGLQVPKTLKSKYEQCKALEQEAKEKLKGMTYIYGDYVGDCFEFNAYLVSLGLEPLLLQCEQFEKSDYTKRIQQAANPYMCRAANLAPLEHIYQELKPALYFGHEMLLRLKKYNIEMFPLQAMGNKTGLEASLSLLRELIRLAAKKQGDQEAV